jgi:DegV family protein with EDD domain
MSRYAIVTDSSADLSLDYLSRNDVQAVPLTVTLDGREFPDDYGLTVGFKEFYAALRGGGMASTAQVSVHQFTECFERILQEGRDILYFGLSAGLSGTYGQSVLAAEELRGKYPDRKIYTVDSLTVTLGLGLLVVKAVKLRDQGKTLEEVRAAIAAAAPGCNHLFTVQDLMFLHRGGRVSKATAVVGGLLSIKPVMLVTKEGKLKGVHKVRGRKQSLQFIANWMDEFIQSVNLENVFIVHGDCEEDAQFLAGLLRAKYNIQNLWVEYLGCTIGAHAGPGTVALFFEGKERHFTMDN